MNLYSHRIEGRTMTHPLVIDAFKQAIVSRKHRLNFIIRIALIRYYPVSPGVELLHYQSPHLIEAGFQSSLKLYRLP